jgi:hypothetical protein
VGQKGRLRFQRTALAATVGLVGWWRSWQPDSSRLTARAAANGVAKTVANALDEGFMAESGEKV